MSSIEDFYRARFLYRLSLGGEAVEAALVTFAQTLSRQSELQTVALEDIFMQLNALLALAADAVPDDGKVHGVLRDLVRVFEGLADNAQAFMAGVARTIELQQADVQVVIAFKQRLIDYLQRFIGDLIARSGAIAARIAQLDERIEPLLALAAERERRDSIPGESDKQAFHERMASWHERWRGLSRWFISEGHIQAQSELLRAKVHSAIPQPLAAVASLNERRSERSDRSTDFRIMARWFADAATDDDAHRLWRAGFALDAARHFGLQSETSHEQVPASTPCADAPAVAIHPRLREQGEVMPRGAPPHVRQRDAERALLAAHIAEERAQIDAARATIANGKPTRLSEVEALDAHAFRLFLNLLGEALVAQRGPDEAVECDSADDLLRSRLEPLLDGSRANVRTALGVFSGRDHVLTVIPLGPMP